MNGPTDVILLQCQHGRAAKPVRIALDKDGRHDSDYSIWEGREVQGWPLTTLLRGKVVVDQGRLLGSPADGRFLKRKLLPEMSSALAA